MPTDPKDFEHDLAILDRYLAYSAEIVRLALLGITAIGYMLTTRPFEEHSRTFAVRTTLWVALVAFGVSVAAGLMHRYYGPDGLGDHLASLRKANTPAAPELVVERNRKFDVSTRLIAIAGGSLFVGALAAAGAFALVI